MERTFWSPAMQSMTAMPRSTPILRRSPRTDIQVDAASFHVSLFTSSSCFEGVRGGKECSFE